MDNIKTSSKWRSVDFLQHHLCGQGWWWIVRPGGNHQRKIHGSTRGPLLAASDPIPVLVCPLQNIASGPQFRLEGGNKGSRARLSPNCHHILEFHVGTLASWLPVASSAWGACAAMRSSKKPWPRYSTVLYGLEGARGVLKGGSYTSRLKFRKRMVLSNRSGLLWPNTHTRT